MREDDYIPDIERQDQIAIDERKKEREERKEEWNPMNRMVGMEDECKFCAIGEIPDKRLGWFWHWDNSIRGLVKCTNKIAKGFEDEIKTVREFVDANCKPKR